MTLSIIAFGAWVVAGLSVLCLPKPVSKGEYAFVLVCLLMYIGMRIFGM